MQVLNQPAIAVGAIAAGLGGGRGVAIPLNNQQWARVFAVDVDWVSDATAGNRWPILDFRDAQGNVLAYTHDGAVQAPSSTNHYSAGAGMPYAGGNFQRGFMPLPSHLLLPPGSYVVIWDADSVGGNADTIAARITLSDGVLYL